MFGVFIVDMNPVSVSLDTLDPGNQIRLIEPAIEFPGSGLILAANDASAVNDPGAVGAIEEKG
ncbi:hypothetical protein X762_17915 [Mesorhizobium sp. LSHC426A00]|nr:hypothetical protein X762_17915 [Mesorhizobium sp. LSHC426A00]ESX51756.1 hypothetical protein X761_24370 [Mesorhizobium sp. LSHC424B00]ESX71845.1 hypothetical protein X757_22345 [Mesorhizobium sp. LSHC414A00]